MPPPTARPGPHALAACALTAAGLALAARAETITVCLDGSCDFTDPVAAVQAAAQFDTIEIAAGIYMLSSPISLYDKDLVIRGAVDANGHPATVLNGQNATYHINALIQTASTVIENLVLTNGRGTSATAVYAFNCTGMTFRNCSVRGNRGGAIHLNGSSVTMVGCEVVDNAAGPGTSAGGGIYVSGSVSLIDCVVSGNASTFSGGGIFLPSGAIANLTRTRVCGNSAPQGAQIGQNSGGTVNDIGGACVSSACVNCQPAQPCPADLNGDNSVNGTDLGALLGAWGAAGLGDLNGDGVVNGIDLGQLVGSWGACG